LVAYYDLQPGNGAGLFSKEKLHTGTGKGVDKYEKSEEKRISGDVNKQTIYIAPKSTNESRVQYSPEPTWGNKLRNKATVQYLPLLS